MLSYKITTFMGGLSGSRNFLETSGSVQACLRIALPFTMLLYRTIFCGTYLYNSCVYLHCHIPSTYLHIAPYIVRPCLEFCVVYVI